MAILKCRFSSPGLKVSMRNTNHFYTFQEKEIDDPKKRSPICYKVKKNHAISL